MNFNRTVDTILKKVFIVEKKLNTRKIIIFPGGFHPFHKGHKSIIDNIEKQFPGSDTYIAITDFTKDRPFTADEKKLIISSAGINPKKIKVVKNPFVSKEITENYDSDKDVVIFALSEKEKEDPAKASLFNTTKKDGTPSYFQPYSDTNLQPFKKHGYLYLFPKIVFTIGGKEFNRASEIRTYYKTLTDQQKIDFLGDMYISNIDKIKKIFDERLGNIKSSEENESAIEIDKEYLKDVHRFGKQNDTFLNPPYKVDGGLTVGRMSL